MEKNWFDPNTYVEMMKQNDVTKMFDVSNFPAFKGFSTDVAGVNAEAITEAQKKNMQAIVDANRVASEGYQAVFKKQVELMQQGAAQFSDLVKETASAPMSTEGVEKRMELVKAHFEGSIEAFTELAEFARKSNEDATSILQARVSEGIEELKALSATAYTNAAA